MRITTAGLVLAALIARTQQPQQPTEQVWALTVDDPEPIVMAAWSPTSTCIAVATDTAVHVIDVSGQPLWAWRFRETTPFLHPRHHPLSAFAVSPGCDVVALSGGSDYKYLWTADRVGRRAFLKTAGTPYSVAFSLQGDCLALTTSARFAYVLSPQLSVRWSGPIGQLPVKWPGQVTDAAAPPAAELLRQDVEELLGVLWGYGHGDSVSDDGQWRVATTAPWRGETGVGVVELWGPGAHGYNDRFFTRADRQPRWTKHMGCANATITRDGLFVIARGDLDKPEYTDGGANDCSIAYFPNGFPIHIFDRDGSTVLTWPGGGYEAGVEEGVLQAVLARTGRPLTLPAPQPPTSVHIFVDLPPDPDSREIRTSRLARPDGGAILIIQDHRLRLDRRPK